MNKNSKFCQLKVLFKTTNKSNNCFRFKDLIPKILGYNRVYQFSCGSCTASYIGKTYTHMKVLVSENQAVSPRLFKKLLKGTLSTSIRNHILIYDHQNTWEQVQQISELKESFDKVWNKGILFKLKENRMTGNLLNVITDFLYQRKQRVVLNRQHSSWTNFEAGVLQGSILESLFFQIYINDLFNGLTSNPNYLRMTPLYSRLFKL